MKVVTSIVLVSEGSLEGSTSIRNFLRYTDECNSIEEAKGQSVQIAMKENPNYLISTVQSVEIKD